MQIIKNNNIKPFRYYSLSNKNKINLKEKERSLASCFSNMISLCLIYKRRRRKKHMSN